MYLVGSFIAASNDDIGAAAGAAIFDPAEGIAYALPDGVNMVAVFAPALPAG
jgi:hypothetical protein